MIARRSALALAAVLIALAGSGCARHLPISELGAQGGNVGVRVVTVTGESVVGRLISLDRDEIVVVVTRRERGEDEERRFPMTEVVSATVHRTRSESTWGPIVSTVIGVAGGVLAAAAIKEWGS
ncbi:hypothetical protein K8S17_01595 [bacterium]|nr:hypothetical protein [bacterium]